MSAPDEKEVPYFGTNEVVTLVSIGVLTREEARRLLGLEDFFATTDTAEDSA